MCEICGCDGNARATVLDPETGASHDLHEHVHADGTRHSHAHALPGHGHEHLELETRILARNDELAERNRAWLAERGLVALNLMGAPGAGKTRLLERTIAAMPAGAIAVIEGDQATANDAQRISAAGAKVVQVNTGTGCHLDASMVAYSLAELQPRRGTIVVVENVGNLVCPALFQLGEHRRVVVFSVTEGDDKPLKYPHMFRAAHLVVLNKVDLLPHVDFDVGQAVANARAVNPDVDVIEVSARSGAGLETWSRWLQRQALEALDTTGPAPGR